MENTILFTTLKIKLQQIGAIRPEAWEMILQLQQSKSIAINKSFNRSIGGIVYIAEGLLKEYNAVDRDSAVIINFMGDQQFIYTNGHNQVNYLKASIPSTLMFWSFADIMQLYSEFPELITIYTQVCKSYADQIAYRAFILEHISSEVRIQLFRVKFQQELVYLKKKDIANYLQLNYDHFLHVNAHI